MIYYPYSRRDDIDRGLDRWQAVLRRWGRGEITAPDDDPARDCFLQALFSELFTPETNALCLETVAAALESTAGDRSDDDQWRLRQARQRLDPAQDSPGTDDRPPAGEVDRPIPGRSFTTHDFLEAVLLGSRLGLSKRSAEVGPWLAWLAARFEITGRVYGTYQVEPPRGTNGYDRIDNYVLLYLALLELDSGPEPDRLRNLNAALKLGDLMVGLMEADRITGLWPAVIAGLIMEQQLVSRLYDRRGFRLPSG